MPTISIITAVLAGRHQHLTAAYQSLTQQQMPEGWDWQWIVQEDGETGTPASTLPMDDRISSGTSRRSRAATTRTMALARADGVLLRTLDADDLLPAGALAQDIQALSRHADLAWCVSPTVDLAEDGTLTPGPRDPDPGPLLPGELTDGEARGLLPVVGTTLCTYTELAIALGGWQALPAIEDVALMLAVEAVAAGWMNAEPGLIYRRWPGSSSTLTAHADEYEEQQRRNVVLDRVAALRKIGWRYDPPDLPNSGQPVQRVIHDNTE